MGGSDGRGPGAGKGKGWSLARLILNSLHQNVSAVTEMNYIIHVGWIG